MRISTRLVLYIGLSSVVPLAVLGTGAATVAAHRVLDQTAELQGRTAQAVAVYLSTWLDLQQQLLAHQARTLPVDRLSPEALAAVPRLVREQTPAARRVVLTDGQGRKLAPTAGVDASPGLTATMEAMLPVLTAEEREARWPVTGAVYRENGQPAVSLAVPVGEGAVLGVELDLSGVESRLGPASDGLQIAVLDNVGAVVLGGGGLVVPGVFDELLGGTAIDIRYETEAGAAAVAASAPIEGVGWTVVVAEPTTASREAVRQIQLRTAYIALVSAALSLVVGVLFARQLATPVESLKAAALRVASGRLDGEVPAVGTDELAELASAFEYMRQQLAEDAERIAAQSAEIAAFNEELQQRIEARTRELQAAQDQLVRSARLAAVGEMGAGLAHELNNPVAGILGLAQILLARAGEGPQSAMLASLEAQARRCKEILGHLLGLSSELDPGAPRAREPVAVDALLADVVRLVRPRLASGGIGLALHVSETQPLRVMGDAADLGRALGQLMASVRAAADGPSELNVRLLAQDDDLVMTLVLRDTAATVGGDDWRAAGMGYWDACRVVAAHGGRVDGPPEGVHPPGAAWRVRLPRMS